MPAFILALMLTALLSGASTLPGMAATQVTDRLRDLAGPDAVAVARLTADPVLELPAGRIPELAVDLTHARFAGYPVSEAHLSLRDLRLDPAALWLRRRPTLQAPAPATLALSLSPSDLQAAAEALCAPDGPFAAAPMTIEIFGRAIETSLALSEPRLAIQGDRLALSGIATLGSLALPVTLGAGLAIAEGGAAIALVKPSLALRGKPLPDALLAGALAGGRGRVPLAALSPLTAGLRLTSLQLSPAGLTLQAAGTLDRLAP